MRRGALLVAAMIGCSCGDDDGRRPAPDAGAEPDAACLVDEDLDRHLAPSCAGDDCDDADGEVHPGADDQVGDLIDEDCDGVDGVDADGDEHASVSSGGDDCDDAHGTIYPGAPEDAAWSSETIVEGNVTFAPDLLRTPDGALHLVYGQYNEGEIHHTSNASGAWETEVIAGPDDTGGAGDYTTAAVDPSGTLHVAYTTIREGNFRTLHYLAGDEDGWGTPEVVDALALDAGYACRIAAGPDGAATVAYWAVSETTSLVVATNASGAWEMEVVESDRAHYWFTGIDIAIDEQGALHLLYPEGPGEPVEGVAPRNFHYATNGTGAWTIEAVTVGEGHYDGAYASLALDAEGAPHAAFTYFELANDVWYATRSDGAWTVERLAETAPFSTVTDLSLGEDGSVFVAYGGAPAAASLAANLGAGWIHSNIELTETSLAGMSMLLDGAGSPEVAFLSGDQTELRFARADGLDQNCDGTGF